MQHYRALSAESLAEPDLTPLLDVVFILLVFFIVTATFIQEIGIDAPQKNEMPRTTTSEQSIILRVRSDNRYYINQRQIDQRSLEAHITRLRAASPDKPLVISTSNDATTEKLVHALDVAASIGLPVSIAALEANP